MNRKNLTAAVLAGLAGAAGIVGSAQAVNINPDGLGQVLIYPYYTTNNNNITLLSVVNTSDSAKAVKVRFTEGQNTREVLDFNLYMSAWDVWTASIATNDDGNPELTTTDTTCTVPYLFGMGGSQEFLPYALTDGGSTSISRATEGHFEMIEMGVLVDDEEGSAKAATHKNGVPNNCAQLVAAWTDPDDTKEGDEGYWLMSEITDLEPPIGGLFGGAAIVNVANANMASYDAIAINGFADFESTSDLEFALHQEPGDVLPALNSGNVLDGTVFLDNGDTLTSSFNRGVDAVSFVFMHDQIMNEYTTETDTLAKTEWVVTFPTKHFYVYGPSAGGSVPVDPFTSVWDSKADDPDACEVVLLDTLWDREERTFQDPIVTGEPVPPVVSPAPPGVIDPKDPIIPFELCYETSVISFGDADLVGATSPMLGSSNFHNIDNTELGFEYGWARLQLDDYPHDYNLDGEIDEDEEEYSRADLGGLNGLPVTGFAVQTFKNGFLGEGGTTIGNYGGIYKHKSTRKLGSDAGTHPMPETPDA
jgi:hypothetical protein